MAVRERQGAVISAMRRSSAPAPGPYEFRVRGRRCRTAALVTVVEATVTSAAWPDKG